MDNLRTNHQVLRTQRYLSKFHCFILYDFCFQGVYVVQDNKFCTLRPLAEGQQFVREAGALVAFPCGAVRGALANLNVNAEVTATVETLPAVKFNIHIAQRS